MHQIDRGLHNSSLNLVKGSSQNGYVAYYAKNIYSGTGPSILTEYTCPDGNKLTFAFIDGAYCITASELKTGDLILPEKPVLNGSEVTSYSIMQYTFQKSGMTSISIPDTVTSIGTYSFSGCDNLSKVTLGDGIRTIGDHAFYGCRSLIEMELPEKLTSIGTEAFKNCIKLAVIVNHSSLDITVGSTSNGYIAYYAKSVTTEEDGNIIHYTDSEGTEYTFIRYGGVVYLLGAYGTTKTLDLPGTDIASELGFETYHVYQYAFRGMSFESVNIPDCVSSIGAYAFYDCKNLKTVTMSDPVSSLGAYSFASCTSLEQVTAPINLNLVASNEYPAFYNTPSLKRFYLTTGTGNGFVYGSSSSSSYTNYYGYLPWYDKSVEITIPEGITSIGAFMFYGNGMKGDIALPSTLKSIGRYAFYGCSGITSINVPETVTVIEDHTFTDCTRLSKVTIGQKVTSIKEYAFYGCSSVFSFTIPKTLTSIGYYAFQGCARLAIVENNSNLNIVAGNSNNGCIAYYAIAVYSSEDADKGVVTFTDSDRSEYVFIRNGTETYLLGAYLTTDTPVLPDKEDISPLGFETYAIYKNTFENTLLKTVTIPDCVTSLGKYAFANCISLEELTAPISLNLVSNNSYSAFYNTPAMKKVILTTGTGKGYDYGENSHSSYDNYYTYLPWYNKDVDIELTEGITSIGNYTFVGGKMKSIELPEGLESIGSYAFISCTGLTDISIPNSVTSIGNYVFSNCKGLQSVDISENATAIGDYMFSNCTGLQSIEIPDNIASIGEYAFYGCSKLKSTDLPENLSSIGSHAFYGCPFETITLPENLKTIGEYAFYGCGLTKIVIPESIETVDCYVFYNSSLEELTILGSNTTLNRYSLAYCYSLEKLTMPISLKIAYSDVFEECYNLREYVLTEGTGYGPDYTYSYYGTCKYLPWYTYSYNIQSISLSENIRYIGSYTFQGITIYDPDDDTTVGKTADDLTGYSIVKINGNLYRIPPEVNTILDVTGVTVDCPETLQTGETTSFTVSLVDGYVLPGEPQVSVTKKNGDPIGLTCKDGVYSFTTPYNDVTIHVSGPIPDTYAISVHGGIGYTLTALNGSSMPVSTMKFGETMVVFLMFTQGYAMGGDFELTVEGNVQTEPVDYGNGFYAYNLTTPYSADGTVDIRVDGVVQYTSHTVVCNVDGKMTTYVVRDGFVLTAEDPVKAGSRFEGWFTDPNFTQPFDKTVGITSDIIIYAKFTGSYGYGDWWILYEDGLLVISGTVVASAPWSAYTEHIEKMELPEGLVSICDEAFKGCTSLTTVTVPSTVTTIGDNAFKGCASLVTVSMPGKCSIGKGTFCGCNSLSTIEFPSVTTIGDEAFKDCTALASVSLPETLTHIGKCAFRGCYSLVTVSIPAGCTVDDGAFSDCASMESFEGCYTGILDGIILVAEDRIVSCASKAVSVTLPYDIVSIGAYAFAGCASLEYLFIPSTVTDIGEHAFDGIVFTDSEGVTITVSSGIYKGSDGNLVKQIPETYNVSFKYGRYTLLSSFEEMERIEVPDIIPSKEGAVFVKWTGYTEGMLATEDMVFEAQFKEIPVKDKLTVTVVYEDGTTEKYTVDEGSRFDGPAYLYYTDRDHECSWAFNRPVEKDITLYAVTVLSGYAGVNWSLDLETGTMTLSGSGYQYNWSNSGDTPWASYRDRILRVVVENGVKSIGQYAFSGCKNLYEVILADSVITLYSYAFYHAYSLEHVVIGKGLTYTGSKVFTGVSFYSPAGKSVGFSGYPGTEYYGSCKNLYAVAMPLTTSAKWSFDEETGTLSIEGKGNLPGYSSAKYAPWYTLKNDVKKVMIGDGITSIGSYSFYAYPNLSEVVMGDDITYIGGHAIGKCNLSYLKISSSLSSVGSVNFSGRYYDIMGNSMKVNVSDLCGKTFERYNDGLAVKCIGGTIGDVEWSLERSERTLKVYGNGSMGNGSSVRDAPWYEYRSIVTHIVIENGVTDIADFAFYRYTSVKTVSISDSVKSIGSNSLRGFTELETISFGNGLETIGSNALTGYVFVTGSGKTLKTSVSNLAGYTFTMDSDKLVRSD